MIHSFFEKYKTYKHRNYVSIALALCTVYFLYVFYVWIKTESTDNAKAESYVSRISAEVNGVITEVLKNENDIVKIGEVIARIDNTIYQENLLQAQHQLNITQEQLKALDKKITIAQLNIDKCNDAVDLSHISFEVASVDFNRVVELSKEKFTSQKILDAAKLSYNKSKFEYNQAKINLALAKQELSILEISKSEMLENIESLKRTVNIAKFNFNNTEIIAKSDGIFANSNMVIGNYVTPGIILFAIVPHKKHVKANYKETQVKCFKPGMKAVVAFDALDKKFHGVIKSIYPGTGSEFSLIPIDNSVGNFTKIVQRVPVIIDLDDHPSLVKIISGMSAKVSVRIDQKCKQL